MSEVELEGPSDDELFNDATSNETPDVPVVEAQVEQPQPEPEVQPDPVVAEAQPEAERPQVDDNAPQVPSWRVREINEEKRALAAENEALKARLAQAPQQQPQQAQPAQPAVEPTRPDPLLDPEGYAKAVREEIRQELLADRREESLQRAREANQAEFDEAYAAARQAVDPALKARMQNSRDPGKTLIEWHRENKVKAEVGHDPNAWLEKKLEERLNDPAFLAKALERARGSAQPQVTNGRPRVELPPSLNGASRSNAALRSTQADLSDDALWDEATA